MFKATLATQTKITARGYLEVRTAVINLVPLALLIGILPLLYRRAVVVGGGLALELIGWLHAVFFYSYKPNHGRQRGTRGRKNRALREVAFIFGRSYSGAHRSVAA